MDKHLAILKLLGGGELPALSAQTNSSSASSVSNLTSSSTVRASNLLQLDPGTSTIALLSSRIGQFLQAAQNAPAIPMDIEIDEETFEDDYNENDDDDEDDEEEMTIDTRNLKLMSALMTDSKKSKNKKNQGKVKDEKKLIQEVDEDDDKSQNGGDDDDDCDESSSGSDIEVISFSSDEEGNAGLDITNLSEEKKQKLQDLFSGKRMMMAGAATKLNNNKKKNFLLEEDEEEDRKQNQEDAEEEEQPPLAEREIHINIVAGVLEEDKEKAQRQGSLLFPTPREVARQKKVVKKNKSKLKNLVNALISE